MVKLLIGQKGSGKTNQMVQLANDCIEKGAGSIIFMNYKIRVICMEDFEHITNIDEYIGFLYGIIRSDHDIETIFIDSILKHADVSLGDLPVFLKRLSGISEIYDLDFVVSVSAEKEEMIGVELSNYEVLN